MNHDEVARDIEQNFDESIGSETEGPDTTRVDFEGEQSVWFSSYPSDGGTVSVNGRVRLLLYNRLCRYLLRKYGSGTIRTVDLGGI